MKYRKERPEEKQHKKKLQNSSDWDHLKTIITLKKNSITLPAKGNTLKLQIQLIHFVNPNPLTLTLTLRLGKLQQMFVIT